LSTIQTTVHVGAHVDAPNHYHASGLGISEQKLSRYLGRCQVVQVSLAPGSRMRVSDIENIKIEAKRILFKTESFPDPDHWNDDFVSLSADVLEYLAKKGVLLVGIDTPSIDPAPDKTLESHLAVYQNDMSILEGLVLTGVSEGKYVLSALPLKILGGDASPVRAVLLEGDMGDLWNQ